MQINGYQSRVHIKQVLPAVNEFITDPKAKFNQFINSSWLFDPFGDNSTYGVEFRVNKSFSWEFFMWAKSSEEAKEKGFALLMSLQERFKGLDGEVNVFPLFSKYLGIERPLYEITIPTHIPTKLHFLRKIINYYRIPLRKVNMNTFILWKRDDLHDFPLLHRYMLKIFVSLSSNRQELDVQGYELKAVLRYLVSDMNIPPHIQVACRPLSSSKWKEIYKCNILEYQ